MVRNGMLSDQIWSDLNGPGWLAQGRVT
jgi:hypothetical protein